jgi:hypothetical protein
MVVSVGHIDEESSSRSKGNRIGLIPDHDDDVMDEQKWSRSAT